VPGLEWATVCVVQYDPSTRVATVASAGHLPPLLMPSGALPSFVSLPAGPPLGVGVDSFESVEVDLGAGSTMLLYTDGLVERRGEALDEGMDRLAEALSGGRPPNEVCASALEAMTTSGQSEDDIAMMVLHHR
jgi:serine phosphatase RsbU (regulator of sigma subunit)